jgi:site-specific recombinase XerD
VSAVASRTPRPRRDPPPAAAPPRPHWEAIDAQAPVLAATLGRYVDQIAACQRPGTARACESDLRGFATFVTGHDPAVAGAADVKGSHVEAYKIHLAARGLKPATIRRRLQTLRSLFVRITEWEWDDAPARVPVFMGDLPVLDDALPKFLDDAAFARLMRAVAAEPDLLRRLVIEVLARTGMRVGELCDLQGDAVVQIGDTHWLRIPVGKLHNDRDIPLHPHLVELLADYRRQRPASDSGLLITNHDGAALNRHVVTRMLNRVATAAGLGHLHPHRLRHTLATQAVNHKMSIEAIAALLGHRSLDMTRRYARISDRTVADEYQAVSAQIENLYGQPLPADAEGPNMRRLRQEHQRMLGNGWCNRPALMDCSFESICETCTYFSTGVEFQPVLFRQRQHARDHGQPQRAELFDHLLDHINP